MGLEQGENSCDVNSENAGNEGQISLCLSFLHFLISGVEVCPLSKKGFGQCRRNGTGADKCSIVPTDVGFHTPHPITNLLSHLKHSQQIE